MEAWTANSFKAMRIEERAKLRRVEKSLAALKSQDTEFAEAHRKLIACRQEICAVIDRHLSQQPQN